MFLAKTVERWPSVNPAACRCSPELDRLARPRGWPNWPAAEATACLLDRGVPARGNSSEPGCPSGATRTGPYRWICRRIAGSRISWSRAGKAHLAEHLGVLGIRISKQQEQPAPVLAVGGHSEQHPARQPVRQRAHAPVAKGRVRRRPRVAETHAVVAAPCRRSPTRTPRFVLQKTTKGT